MTGVKMGWGRRWRRQKLELMEDSVFWLLEMGERAQGRQIKIAPRSGEKYPRLQSGQVNEITPMEIKPDSLPSFDF